MPVVTACSSCNTRLRLPDNLPETTRAVRCPRCGASVPVPTPVTAKVPTPVIVPVPVPVPMTFACPHCRAEVACDNRLAGRRVACPHCQGQFQMPGATAAVQSYPPPPEPVIGATRGTRQGAPAPGRRGWVIGSLSSIAGILAIVFVILLVLPSSGASSLGDEVRYFPEDTRIVASLDIGGAMRSVAWKKLQASKLFQELQQNMGGPGGGPDVNKLVEQAIGIPLDDFQRITLAMPFPAELLDGPRPGMRGGPPDLVVVFKARNASRFNPSAMGGPAPIFRDETVGRYTIKEADGFAYCVADSGTVVLAPTVTLKKILQRDAPAPLSAGMREAMAQADFSNALTVAASIRDLGPRERDMLNQAMPRDLPPELVKIRDAADGAVAQIRVDTHLDLRLALVCKDAAKAGEIKDMLNGKLDELRQQMRGAKEMPAEVTKILETLKFTASGNAVRIGVRLDLEGLLRTFEAQMEQNRRRQPRFDQRWDKGPPPGWDKGFPEGVKK